MTNHDRYGWFRGEIDDEFVRQIAVAVDSEPIHVTFARVVMGCTPGDFVTWWSCPCGKHLGDSPLSYLRRYDLDRAFCQELAECNKAFSVWSEFYEAWVVRGSRECDPPGTAEDCPVRGVSKSWCEAVLRWAIAAKQAGVPVRLPGGER